MGKNVRLQKLKSDIEKDSNELDKIDPKNLNLSDRQRLTNHWLDLQEKLNDQHVEFIYKSTNPSSTNHLGEIHLKTPNQDHEHLQIARLQRQPMPLIDPFDNQDGIYRSNQVNYFCFDKSNFFFFLDIQWTRIKNQNSKTYDYHRTKSFNIVQYISHSIRIIQSRS
jgi:hypothetical protein